MRNSRWILFACTLVLFACATQPYDTQPAATGDMHSGMSMDNSRTALSKAMRDLWADHVVWTRNYIIAAASGSPDAQAAANRLLANQDRSEEHTSELQSTATSRMPSSA